MYGFFDCWHCSDCYAAALVFLSDATTTGVLLKVVQYLAKHGGLVVSYIAVVNKVDVHCFLF